MRVIVYDLQRRYVCTYMYLILTDSGRVIARVSLRYLHVIVLSVLDVVFFATRTN